ncbi:hypothetical protein CS022_14685 [Veronia nyctiphanis]|uniref:Bacterial Ig-like domain-containing protein n=1 Tax=Veronia nyctiphanis TaxID=1278244 RepID=A0A4Q0YNU6_9GAMM|nr:Ig-like domain-containing protein [Veronia nyctiphanis]RXJ72556.1 hypothetical protein CS022_14685 [Veronia nyctiphanis]
MAELTITSLNDIKVAGFDLVYINSQGTTEKFSDALVAIAKGDLVVIKDGEKVPVDEIIKSSGINVKSLESVFLENVLTQDQKLNQLLDQVKQQSIAKDNALKKIEQLEREKLELKEQKKEADDEKAENARKENLDDTLDELSQLNADIKKAQEELAQKRSELKQKNLEQLEVIKVIQEQPLSEEVLAIAEELAAAAADGEEGEEEEGIDEEGKAPKLMQASESLESPTSGTSSGSSNAKPVEEEIPPNSLSVSLAKEDDSGRSGDFITNVNAGLTLVGTTNPSSKVSLEIDGNKFDVVADASGNFEFELDSEFVDGEYEILIESVDTNGQEAAFSKVLVIDTVAPDAPSVALSDESDTGIKFDKLTYDNKPFFNGKGEAGTTVVFAIAGRKYKTSVKEDETWEIQITER